ncbi:MAG: sigma-70 family RNA polymerase sigma factor [Planctomycetes bacterium]|nr:sigma-70 family RNA polymerase sigma factor [Planctomycetota bacterium]MCC7171323.1 sigma-70 family RNA polymerase sigma factor [Planctomycetota bacterium]
MSSTTTTRFEELVREHHAAVYRAALRVTQHADDAADAAQQAFVLALEQGDRLLATDHPERVLKWLAVKQALMILRGERRRRARETTAVMELETTSPSDSAQWREHRDAARAALRELPREIRLAIELRFGEDLTFKDVAHALDVSEPTAYERVQRGLATLRQRLRANAGAVLALPDAAIESLARESTRLAPAPVPSGLEHRLLALSAKSAGSTLALLPLFVTASVLLSAFVLVPLLWKDEPTRDIAIVGDTSPQDPKPAAAPTDPLRTPVPAQDPNVPPAPKKAGAVPMPNVGPPRSARVATTAILHGRVAHADGRTIDGMRVEAASVVRDGKMPREGGVAEVRADGSFDLAVKVLGEPDEGFTLTVLYENAPIHSGGTIRVKGGEERTLDLWLVTLDVPTARADWTIDATLIAPDRALPDGTTVMLWRLLPTMHGADYSTAIHVGGGTTTAGGRVNLAGSWLGPMRIELEVLGETTYDRYRYDFVVDSGGSTQRTFSLPEPTRWIDTQPDDGVLGFEPPPPEGNTGAIVAHVRTAEGNPLMRAFHDVDAIRVDGLDADAIALDVVPNRLFRDSVQVCAGGSPPETDVTHLAGLKPGRYVVIAYDQYFGDIPAPAPGIAGPVDVGDGANVDVEVATNARGVLGGIVRDVDGAPVADAVVVITGRGPITDERVAKLDQAVRESSGEGTYWFSYERSDAEGRFTFGAIPPGITVRAVALHPEREPAFTEFATLTTGGKLADLEARFVRERAR